MKNYIALALSAVLIVACRSSDGPPPRSNDQDGVERICSIIDTGDAPPFEFCICKTATEATDCPD